MLLTYFLNYRKVLSMRCVIALFLLLAGCTQAQDPTRNPAVQGKELKEKPMVIAVIDTGFGYRNHGHGARLCKYGHKDFSQDQNFDGGFVTKAPVPRDLHGHGTNIVGLIERGLKGETNYCIVIIKFYSDSQTGRQNLRASVKALTYAANIKAKIVNYSGGGPESDEYEGTAVRKLLLQGAKVVAAAGNEHADIGLASNYYFPAQYDPRVVVVGNGTSERQRAPSSNYGNRVNRWEYGTNQEGFEIKMTGTSQATAIATGKIAAEMLHGK